eukprot:TRINITY_DN4366_c0_g1_i1.p1 TRINITY_DN4366_c0_g1~~TRINITY_DN4366_c0_g1_i1.p1  ORF type:complete len:886 (+),score=201.57 TRINITY_DN4366_c0_g1_i1:55-2712(+)
MDVEDLTSLLTEEDYPYEEDCIRHPYYLKSWWRYLEFKIGASPQVRFWIYERALNELPGSYKLWHNYLKERMTHVQGKFITDSAYEAVNATFERCLTYMHKMPRIWIEYCQFLVNQIQHTRTRRTFDRALAALPITQHERIWKIYLQFVKEINVPETAVRIYRRYMKLEPGSVEQFIDYLLKVERLEEASRLLVKTVNDDGFVSKTGKSRHELWLQLCDLVSKNSTKIDKTIKVEALLRAGIDKFTDEVGRLWCSLADYYIRQSHFEKARDVFEEALNSVMTIRDFSKLWDAYTTFEDSLIAAKLELQQTHRNLSKEEREAEEAEMDLRMARYEHLLGRRDLLVSSVMLRRNPHNVYEWHKRIQLYEHPQDIVETFTMALRTIDPVKAVGKTHTLWNNFARFYEQNGDIEQARAIFEKAVQAPFKTIDHLASVWCEYAEMELRQQNYQEALSVLQRATLPPVNISKKLRGEPVQKKIFKSVKLWSFYADIEESLGTFQTTKAVYDKIIELRIATPQVILNYAAFLEENKYFEESFKIYEKGVNIFPFPYALDIWITYLKKFVGRYGGKKLERARDLYEQAVEKVPAETAKILYTMYAQLEETYGLARHAMSVYDRATRAVAEADRYKMYLLYISKAAELFGVTKTREIFQKAIGALPENDVKNACLRFAEVERKLGEIDRARAIYVHASQYCDPRVEGSFWQTWHQFEVRHGNEETFREMLRIKRSVQAQYNTQVNFMSAEMLAANVKAEQEDHLAKRRRMGGGLEDEMQALEAQAMSLAGSLGPEEVPLPSGTTSSLAGDSMIRFSSARPTESELEELVRMGSNPEEINLREAGEDDDMSVDEVDVPENDVDIVQLPVPNAVFGSSQPAEGFGARDRLKKKRKK